VLKSVVVAGYRTYTISNGHPNAHYLPLLLSWRRIVLHHHDAASLEKIFELIHVL